MRIGAALRLGSLPFRCLAATSEEAAAPMIVMIDNYDSFVQTLASYLRQLGDEVRLVRNDQVDVARLMRRADEGQVTGVVISPGPKTPAEAGESLAVVRAVQRRARQTGRVLPTLGVCLGHQAIAQANGARVVRGPRPMHGKVTAIEHDGLGVFAGLPRRLKVTRYHSLVVDETSLPVTMRVDARADDGAVMAVSRRDLPVYGVQFHPEAVLTSHGLELLANFLRICAQAEAGAWRPDGREGLAAPARAMACETPTAAAPVALGRVS